MTGLWDNVRGLGRLVGRGKQGLTVACFGNSIMAQSCPGDVGLTGSAVLTVIQAGLHP